MRIFISGDSGVVYEFQAPDAYSPGQPLGLVEAQALNRLVCENVARNKATMVRRREAIAPDTVLEVDDLREIGLVLRDYVTLYSFAPQAIERRGDIEREALIAHGIRDCVCPSESLCNLCLEEGRRRVIAKAGIAAKALAEL